MGAGASKQAGKSAAAVGRRQYPSSSSILNSAPSTSNAPAQTARVNVPSQVHPDPKTAPATDKRDRHVDLDARDPQFGAALRRVGQATPANLGKQDRGAFPTSSQPPVGQQGQNIFPTSSSANNISLLIVQARDKIAQRTEQENEGLGRGSFQGRTLISAQDIKEALRLRDELGQSSKEVEKQMRLKPGILDQYVVQGVVANA